MTKTAHKARAAKSGVTVTVVARGSALPSSLSAVMTDIASDKKKSEDFLIRAGIITTSGKLAPQYS